MDQPEIPPKLRILVAPLDWGLGHATRCIPVIHSLLQNHCEVLLAGEGKIQTLLQQEFPNLKFIELRGYNVSYSTSKWTLPFVIATQIPKILSVIKYENERLKELVKEHRIDAVISDNRYGLYHRDIPGIFITHQLLIKTPLGNRVNRSLQKINYSYINHFTECWVPDHKHEPDLAGEMSHPQTEPSISLRYVGPLSRFHSSREPSKENHLLIVLSGPEPQRTMLEDLLIRQLRDYKEPVVLVRGLPVEARPVIVPQNITVYDHLPAEELNKKMWEASYVISRCGYSTVMDLAALKKKSILIPTPGQTEQEYLAAHLMKQNLALCIAQGKFKLKAALALARNFNYRIDGFVNEPHLESAVKSFLYKVEFKHH